MAAVNPKVKIIEGLRRMGSALGDPLPRAPVVVKPDPYRVAILEETAALRSRLDAMWAKADTNRLFGLLLKCRDRLIQFVDRAKLRDMQGVVTTSTAAIAMEAARLVVKEAPFVVASKASLAVVGAAVLTGAGLGLGVGCVINKAFGEPWLGDWGGALASRDEIEKRAVSEALLKEFGNNGVGKGPGRFYGELPPPRNSVAKK